MSYTVRELIVGNLYEYTTNIGTVVVKVLSGAYFLKLNSGYVEVETVEVVETKYDLEAYRLPDIHEIWLDDQTNIRPMCSLERLLYED